MAIVRTSREPVAMLELSGAAAAALPTIDLLKRSLGGRGERPDRARGSGAGRVGEGCRAPELDYAAAADDVAAGGATGRLALPEDPVEDEGFGFAALLIAEELAAGSEGVNPRAGAGCGGFMAGDVVIGLDGAMSAARIAEIAAALGTRR